MTLPFSGYTGGSWLGQAAKYAVPGIVRRLALYATIAAAGGAACVIVGVQAYRGTLPKAQSVGFGDGDENGGGKYYTPPHVLDFILSNPTPKEFGDGDA